jgi:protein-L-isoaspartate(D-aspartate) O-methyltransferase
MADGPMNDSVEAARQRYAQQLRAMAHMQSPAVVAAFATVPRERFVGPGPWLVMGDNKNRVVDDGDARQLYFNVLVALDENKGINNGQPSLWAEFIDWLDLKTGDSVLHLGCGTGYYTAILAEVVGTGARVTAVEIDQGIAERARAALAPWPQVTLIEGDGAQGPWQPVDALVVSAGATHPLAEWLDAVKAGGRLVFPLTSDTGPGAMVCLRRVSADQFSARLAYGAQFIPFEGARDAEAGRRLAEALERDRGAAVRSLRCDAHAEDESCWLHGEGWCFSKRETGPPNP